MSKISGTFGLAGFLIVCPNAGNSPDQLRDDGLIGDRHRELISESDTPDDMVFDPLLEQLISLGHFIALLFYWVTGFIVLLVLLFYWVTGFISLF